MTTLYSVIVGDGTRFAAFRQIKRLLVAIVALVCGVISACGESLQSPRGREVFGAVGMAAPRPSGAGGPRTVLLAWDYPVNLQTPDLIFKIYHSTNALLPLKNWPLLTNVPGTVRTAAIVANRPIEWFVVTASNFLGESGYSGR